MSSIANQTNDDSLGTLLHSDTFTGTGNNVAYTYKNKWFTAPDKCICFIAMPPSGADFGVSFNKNAGTYNTDSDIYKQQQQGGFVIGSNDTTSSLAMELMTKYKIQTTGNTIMFELDKGDYISACMRAVANYKIILKVYQK